MPSLSSVRTLATCCLLVSGLFTEIVQHIHSLRASGVRSSHIASASASDARVCCKSSGASWTTPPEISLLVIDNVALSRTDCRDKRRLQLPLYLLPCQIVTRRISDWSMRTVSRVVRPGLRIVMFSASNSAIQALRVRRNRLFSDTSIATPTVRAGSSCPRLRA